MDPNKLAYSDATGYRNPFHVKELHFDEFVAAAAVHFSAVRLFTQRNLTGSLVEPLAAAWPTPIAMQRVRHGAHGIEETERDATDAMYFVAACAASLPALAALPGMLLLDRDERLVAEAGLASAQRLDDEVRSHRATARVVEAMRDAGAVASRLRRELAVHALDAGAEQHDYDIIIPAFNAPEALQRCLDSLLANTAPRHRVHVIDDASTDPRVEAMMRGYARRHPHVRYYRLPANVGFPGAVNCGLASTVRDVVLVNSDTVFPPGWLARMDRCRRSDPAIHAVSPLSNNATICSVPRPNVANVLPTGTSVADMDRLVERTSLRRYPRVPTVVGFCMLISREAVNAVGPFDMVFGAGTARRTTGASARGRGVTNRRSAMTCSCSTKARPPSRVRRTSRPCAIATTSCSTSAGRITTTR